MEVPHQEAEMEPLLPLSIRLREIPRRAAVLGLDDAGVPQLLQLPEPGGMPCVGGGNQGQRQGGVGTIHVGQPGAAQPAGRGASHGD